LAEHSTELERSDPRYWRRVSVDLPAEYRVSNSGGDWIGARLEDVGGGGACLAGTEVHEKSEMLVVRLPEHEGEKLPPIRARVVAVERGADGAVCHVAFEDVSPCVQRRLCRLVNRLQVDGQ
jgi:c-di-GMP-binding flagellar brake protein YcgR